MLNSKSMSGNVDIQCDSLMYGGNQDVWLLYCTDTLTTVGEVRATELVKKKVLKLQEYLQTFKSVTFDAKDHSNPHQVLSPSTKLHCLDALII